MKKALLVFSILLCAWGGQFASAQATNESGGDAHAATSAADPRSKGSDQAAEGTESCACADKAPQSKQRKPRKTETDPQPDKDAPQNQVEYGG